jgi:hypothetical protein
MPPKAVKPRSVSCRGRDVTQLQEYLKNPSLLKQLFASAMNNDSFLKDFDGQVHANECVFSYPDTEWYSVYLLDENGQKYWNAVEGRAQEYYFKLRISPDGQSAFTSEGTTDISKTDIGDKQHCVINANGNCVLPPKANVPTRPIKARIAKPPTAEMSSLSLDVDPSVLQQIPLQQKAAKAKKSLTREQFENIKDKTVLVKFMIDNMEEQDVIECIRRTSESPSDVAAAEVYTSARPSGPAPPPSAEEISAVNIAAQMPQTEVKKMLKRITKDDIIKDLKSKFSEPVDIRNAIIELCKGAGKMYKPVDTKRGPKLKDFNDEQVELDQALDECAAFEAERVRQRMIARWSSVMARSAEAQRKGKIPSMEQGGPSEVPEAVPQMTADSIISEINEIPDEVARKNAIVQLCVQYGYTTKPSKRAVGGIALVDPDDEVVPDNIALSECAALKAATMASVAFGKRMYRRRKRVSKKAPPKRKKVSPPKRKKVIYRTRPTRKSPRVSATSVPVGTVRSGVDGNSWKVKKASNGVKRWVKI